MCDTDDNISQVREITSQIEAERATAKPDLDDIKWNRFQKEAINAN
jgi:hypothetical protein